MCINEVWTLTAQCESTLIFRKYTGRYNQKEGKILLYDYEFLKLSKSQGITNNKKTLMKMEFSNIF